MTDRPIIFSAPMVRSLLAGMKTETSRLAWRSPPAAVRFDDPSAGMTAGIPSAWQRVAVGDRLWVREAWSPHPGGVMKHGALHRAGHEEERGSGPRVDHRWRTPLHMPRWASRITLLVTDAGIQRLHDLNNLDALHEGTPDHRTMQNGWDLRECFARLWDSLHGPGAWAANPEVVVIRFTVEPRNIDA